MSSKVGRNMPCPCGSGTKYKKCCLAADQARESEALHDKAQAPVAASVAATLSRSDPSKAVRRAEMPELRPHARAAARSTKQLCERLAQYGIETTREAFTELARERDSAWSIGEDVWLPAIPGSLDDDARQFVCLAACELWRRWDVGADENTRRSWLAGGYRRTRENDAAGATDSWSELWRWMLPQLGPLMRELADADPLLGGEEFMANWVQDFSQEFRNAALGKPEYAQQGIRFCQQVLAQFTAAAEEHVECLRGDLADMLVLVGDRQQAEAILGAMLEAHPDKCAGYVRLADALTLRSNEPADLDRAISLLEQALAYPVVDPGAWDLEARLDDLRKSRAPTTTA